MMTVCTAADLRARIREWRARQNRIALVPTMGNLHAGHLRLVQHARASADRVVVSIFVNPMQFGPGEDFARYPRTLEADRAALMEADADLLFLPDLEVMYPRDLDQMTRVEVPALGDILCGAARPGHFAGVSTVVAKLFNLVQPDSAVFGEKDYQQLVIIRRMVEDLNIPVSIEGITTVREPDGLAMSSRNRYLEPGERAIAPRLYQVLCEVRERLSAGERDHGAVEQAALEALTLAGFEPDYVSIRRAADLASPAAADQALRVLAAARLGAMRLIDNIEISIT
ncbi:MAG: pantoate--beta-alanine ligase [Gammaproteobacteria bacterium]|nr:pantoate--beta-alanine ligase [Gammaproteobacteria bacterium]